MSALEAENLMEKAKILKKLKTLSLEDGLILLQSVNFNVGKGTLLSLACLNNFYENTQDRRTRDKQGLNVIRILLAAGVNPNIYDNNEGDSPLMILINYIFGYYALWNEDMLPMTEYIDCIELLLKAGADPNEVICYEIDNEIDGYQYIEESLLSRVANSKRSDESHIKMMLKYGAKMSKEEEEELLESTSSYVKYHHKLELERVRKEVEQSIRDELYAIGGAGYLLARNSFDQANKL